MIKKKLVIGLSGLARAGKDTFCALLIEELAKAGLVAKRFALADRLKAELREFILFHYSIDISNCTPEQKELVREFLVFHGKMKRIESNAKHWTGLVQKEIERDNCDVAIVTDVRYDIYPEDEVTWLKTEMEGVLVHIKRYTTKDADEHGFATSRVYVQPPNKDEELNDPRLVAKATYGVDWATGDIEKYCRPEVVAFIQFLKEKAYLSL